MSQQNKEFVRRWFEKNNFDQLGMFQQLGVVNLR